MAAGTRHGPNHGRNMTKKFKDMILNSGCFCSALGAHTNSTPPPANRCLIGPGVFDGISTKVAGTIGFDFLYLTGAGATGSATGQPDLSVMTQTEFADLARMMAFESQVPILADADTGFGGPVNIRRTVELYER